MFGSEVGCEVKSAQEPAALTAVTVPRRTVLLVEDEVPLRRLIARAVAAEGCQVLEAGTCQEAVSLLQWQPVTQAVIDINLPDGTGWDVLEVVRQRGGDIPVLVYSALPPSTERVRALRPASVLLKPFPMQALMDFIARDRFDDAETSAQLGVRGASGATTHDATREG
jgi:DNA-binding response OmpR family regulator